MKNYIDITNRIDLKRIESDKQKIEKMQAEGKYPLYFTMPTTIQYELTGDCNLNCAHCYNRSGDSDVVRNAKMTPEDWKSLSRQLVKDGGVFQCILSGGDPLLLGKHLYEIMDILSDDGTSFILITNGFLLNKETIKRLTKYRYYWFQISIDGSTPELHDSFRGVKNSWARAVQGAMEIAGENIRLTIAHTVTPKNLQYLPDMVELAYKIGASSIEIGEVLPSGRAASNEDLILSVEQKNQMLKMISELSLEYEGTMQLERSMNVTLSMKKYVTTPNNGCIIRPNGDVRLDCMAPFVIGNVLKDPFKKIWTEKGINAWKNERVLKFIDSIDAISQKGDIPNHVNQDVYL